MIEFFDLFSDVSEECVAGPASDHHDEENGAAAEEHGHSCSRSD